MKYLIFLLLILSAYVNVFLFMDSNHNEKRYNFWKEKYCTEVLEIDRVDCEKIQMEAVKQNIENALTE